MYVIKIQSDYARRNYSLFVHTWCMVSGSVSFIASEKIKYSYIVCGCQRFQWNKKRADETTIGRR